MSEANTDTNTVFFLHSEVHRDWQKNAPCLLSLFYKNEMFCCYFECTQIKEDSKGYYSYLYEQKYFKVNANMPDVGVRRLFFCD